MAEEKKEVVVLLNRSKRHYDGLNAEGKMFRHSPGMTAEYTPEQAAQYDAREMVDITTLAGATDKTALKKENADLRAEKAALEARLAALAPKMEEVAAAVDAVPTEEDGGSRKKGKK